MKPAATIPRKTTQGHAIQYSPGWSNVSRGAALGVVVVTTFDLLEVLAFDTSAVKNWLCHFRMMSQSLCIAILATLATALFMYSMKPGLPGSIRMAAAGLVALVAAFAGWELWDITQQVPENLQQTAMCRPLWILMLLAVIGIGILVGDSRAVSGKSSIFTIAVSSLLTVLGFVVVTLQSGSIGDPIPSAAVPAILVPGCTVDADGTPSEALTDRVATGSRLQISGHGKLLVLSGGPGKGTVTEAAAMKKLALADGVPETALLPDPAGISAAHAIQFVSGLPELREDRRVIVVSHWYQLARLRMLGRHAGIQVIAVPAEQEHALFDQNQLYAQEVTEFLRTCLEPARRLLHQ